MKYLNITQDNAERCEISHLILLNAKRSRPRLAYRNSGANFSARDKSWTQEWKRIFPRCRQNDARSASHSVRSIHPRNHGCNRAVRDARSARFLRCLPVDCPRSTLMTSSKLGDSLRVTPWCVYTTPDTHDRWTRVILALLSTVCMFTWTRVRSHSRFIQFSRFSPSARLFHDNLICYLIELRRTRLLEVRRKMWQSQVPLVFFNSRSIEATGDWLTDWLSSDVGWKSKVKSQ